MNLFEAVKEAVTTRQAAENYGIWVNRNGMEVCPFHNAKHEGGQTLPLLRVSGGRRCD